MTAALAILPLAALAGLALGSYAVTAGLRLSRREGSAVGRSHCDSCGLSLPFSQTIPVASYLRLKGACCGCGARIDPLHLVGEIAGLLVVLTAFASTRPLTAGVLSVLGLSLVTAATVDSKLRRLPDICTAIVAICGVVLSFQAGWPRLEAGLAASGGSTAILLLLRAASQRWRGEVGLGLGDVKLIAALALWLGVATPVMVVVASALGLAAVPWVKGDDRRLPFGPMIAAASWIVGIGVERGWLSWAL